MQPQSLDSGVPQVCFSALQGVCASVHSLGHLVRQSVEENMKQ